MSSKIDREQSKYLYRHENDVEEEWGCIDCADKHVRSLAFANLESVANLEQNDRASWIRDCFCGHDGSKAKVTRDYAGDYCTLVPFVFIGLLDL